MHKIYFFRGLDLREMLEILKGNASNIFDLEVNIALIPRLDYNLDVTNEDSGDEEYD